MADRKNYLLGRGELLTKTVKVPSGGGPKKPPYEFDDARVRMAHQVESVEAAIDALPGSACPGDEAVALLTLHPRYQSKSDYPTELLNELELRPIGSRSVEVVPESWGLKQPPSGAVATTQLFVAGSRRAFRTWGSRMASWAGSEPAARQIVQVESLAPAVPHDKVRAIPADATDVLLEAVLHTGASEIVTGSFFEYAARLGARPDLDRRRQVGGLCFLPVTAPVASIEQLAAFTFLRVLRGMPKLRPLRPAMLRSTSGFEVALPAAGPLDGGFRVAVFDGGIPAGVGLGRWVQLHHVTGVSAPVPEFEQHGLAVTSALLFGPLHPGVPADRPYAPIDHYRVLGEDDANDSEDLFDVLSRITSVLRGHTHRYHFVNISIGPDSATEDDEVTTWTAALDELFARADVLATVAVGNTGQRDRATGLARIQPPSDAVNVLAVGAADSIGSIWDRAIYSSTGPGRSPGVVKPDGVAFGGTKGEPFHTLESSTRANQDQGTSFAAPFALRTAVGVRAHIGDRLTALALRALMIHRAEFADGHTRADVGWGRFPMTVEEAITCGDDEVHVVYQGVLPVGQHLRALIPLPAGPLRGMISVAATLAIASQVDPEHAVTYTRSGLEVAFRPNAGRYKFDKTTKQRSTHAATVPFFNSSMYRNEIVLREEGHKWEPCISAWRAFQPASLSEPHFDIYHHHREAGGVPSGAGRDPVRADRLDLRSQDGGPVRPSAARAQQASGTAPASRSHSSSRGVVRRARSVAADSNHRGRLLVSARSSSATTRG